MRKILLFITFLFIFLTMYNYYPYTPMAQDIVIDKLVVDKSERKLMAFENGKLVKTMSIALGYNPKGDKEKEGDEKTPEGEYIINDKAGFGQSGYYKNLGISYPNNLDKSEALKKGFSPGGDIKIHGLKNGLGFIGRIQSWRDWTNGCIAITNQEMDDLYKHVKIGTPITINP